MKPKLNDRTVLITGCNGFIGSHLCVSLIRDKHCNITGIDSIEPSPHLESYQFLNERASSGDKDSNGGQFLFERIDISDAERLEKFFGSKNRFDFIFHLAAIANPRLCKENFDLAFRINVNGTKNVVRHAKNSRLIFMSSAAVYGNPVKIPIPENHPRSGNDTYAITKKMGEDICRCYSENYSYELCIARNFNTFGERQIADYIIPTLIKQAVNEHRIEIWNSSPVRDFLYIKDALNALCAIAEHGDSGETYNIGSGNGTRIGELAATVKEIVDKDMHINDLQKEVIGSNRLIADNSKLRELGWQQRVGLQDALHKTIEWFKTYQEVVVH